MHRTLIISAAFAALVPSLSAAQERTPETAFAAAVASGVCGEPGVQSASWTAENTVEAVCNSDGFLLPLGNGGALLPAAALGGIFVALAASGGGGTTNGTNR